MSDVRFVLKSVETGKYIALDSMSGGYPYEVDSIWLAQHWVTKDEAVRYTAVSSWKDYDHPLYEVFIVHTDETVLEMPKGEALRETRMVMK